MPIMREFGQACARISRIWAKIQSSSVSGRASASRIAIEAVEREIPAWQCTRRCFSGSSIAAASPLPNSSSPSM